mgnify:CR=1 FL=1
MSAPDPPRLGGGPEFDLIRDYFSGLGARADVILGVGDDCALLQPPPGHQLALTTDTLVSGVHFFPDCDPEALGHKALAVNLSDLAAMGAEPAWISLGLTLPDRDPNWLQGFSRGLGDLLRRYGLQLVGGDTTRGPLTICIQAIGFCPPGQALVLIAGGIGITPMISMLRYLRDTGDNRPVHLLWSNRTRPDLIFQAELEGLARELTAFTMVPIFTREPPGEYMTGRLDRPTLQQQLGGADRSAAVFIRGPPRMMAAAARDMRALGLSLIHI